ncbi:MAG: hypothetical protein K6A80_10625 [Saccharofermentans sp.]|nr:hypothetical protein [Saccharofermentans sp.]
MEKVFGSLKITWPKLIIFAVVTGVYTGVMASLPITKDTSFADISITFECWILFGIIIIVNSTKPLESALKCFVFFLISQPLVYLVEVPFNPLGWEIFQYYPPWFVWTLLTLPMGFVGYFMRHDKWYSLVILTPMLAFLGYHYSMFLRETYSFFPNHLLTTIFCLATLIIYPLFIFKNKKLKIAGIVISILIIIGGSILALSMGKDVYNTTLLVESGKLEVTFDDTYNVYLEDESYGKVFIVYEENIESYMVNAELIKTGDTKLILEAPDGSRKVFDLTIERNSYQISEAPAG